MKGPHPTIFGLGIAVAIAGATVSSLSGPSVGAARAAEARAQGAEANVISGLSARQQGGRTVVVLKGSAIPSFTAYRLSQPARLVIDVSNGRIAPAVGEGRQLLADTWAVGQVSVDERTGDSTQVTRLLIALKRESSYTVHPEGHDLVVTISPDELPPALPAPVAPAVAQKPPARDLEQERIAADLQRLIQARAKDLEQAQKSAAAYKDQLATAQKALKQAEEARRAEETRLSADRAQAEQAVSRALGQKQRTEEDLGRLERTRSELFREQHALAARLGQEQKQGTSRLTTLRQQTEKTEQQAQLTQEHVATAQAALRKAEQTRAQVEEARRAEEARLSALLQARAQAEEQMAQQSALLRTQREEIVRLQKQQKTPAAPPKVEGPELAFGPSLPPPPAPVRPAPADREISAQLQRMQKELLDAQTQTQALQVKAAQAQKAMVEAETQRAEAERARQAEEARLATLAQRKAEAQRARQNEEAQLAALTQRAAEAERSRQAEEAQLQTVAQKKAEAERARQAEEARLAALSQKQREMERARQAEEARLATLSQKQLEAERARRNEEARLATLSQKQLEAERARQSEEAHLATLSQKTVEVQKARQSEEAHLATLSQQTVEAQKARRSEEAHLATLSQKTVEAQKARRSEEAHLATLTLKASEAERARQAEEARLASLSQRKVEAQRARQSEEAHLATLSQQTVEAQKARRSEEAHLLSLTQKATEAERARQTEEARLASLTQKQVEAERARRAEETRLSSLSQKQIETERARQAEEARLALVAQKKAETERARQAEEARLALVAQKKAETERARQAEEARLAALTRARQKAESDRLLAFKAPAPAPAVATATAAANDGDNEIANAQVMAWPMRRAVTLRPYTRPIVAETEAPEAAAPARGQAPRDFSPRAALAVAGKETLVPVRDVRFEDDGQVERVIIDLDGTSVETSVYTDNRTAVLRLVGASLSRGLSRTLDATAYNGPVQSISSFPDPRNAHAVRLVVAMSKQVAPTLLRRGARLLWEFPRSFASNPVRVYGAARVAGFGNPSIPMQLAPANGSGPPQEPLSVGRRAKRYNGRRIDLDFKDADIHNILRLLSDVGQVNIVTGDDVKGSVTIRMRDVPWDQALDVILKAKGLGYSREGNLIRVAPQVTLDKEAEAETARLKNKVELQPIETRLIPLSYAQAANMVKRVQDVLSPRGKASFDDRTNILIISDMAPNIALAEDLLRNLDTQIPQVLIEARIVEAQTTFSRDIGIQWGGGYTASAASGNPTGLSFPSSVGVAGGNDSQAGTQGLTFNAANPQYVVNNPAAVGQGAGGALGIALGSLNNLVNVNLRLSAAESNGNVRIVSAPKVMTTDNYSASITQGVSIPVSVVSAAGANTQFFDAKLELRVKPHVTNEGAVLMDITVTKNEPGAAGANGIPSISKREVRTQMLVRDGDTTVIGGIYTRNTNQNYTKIPGLGDIPILGWLFKKKLDTDNRSELLVFITPRIVNRASSISPPAAGAAP